MNTKNNALYWKSNSIIWPLLSVAVYAAALLIQVVLPTVQSVNVTYYRVFLGLAFVVQLVRYIVSRFLEQERLVFNHKAQFYFAGGIVLILWDLLSAKTAILPLPFFPGPAQIAEVFATDYTTLFISTAYSLRLFFVGFLTGTVLGIVSGVLTGWLRQWEYWLSPVIKVTGIIPAVAWIPIAMAIFPNSFSTAVFLIAMCSWFPVSFMTASGIAGVQKSYFEAARTLGASPSYLLWHVAIPGSLPSIFTGISTATGLSFGTLVVSEMIGAKAGLGWYINWAKGWSAYAKVYAAIIVMAIAFSIILAVINLIKKRLLLWQKGLVI
ncbi:MAG: ABC transporter permease [Lachnospiraceae bacterium]